MSTSGVCRTCGGTGKVWTADGTRVCLVCPTQYGVWCVQDRAWCGSFRGTRAEADAEVEHWRSGVRADVAPGAFTYEVRPI